MRVESLVIRSAILEQNSDRAYRLVPPKTGKTALPFHGLASVIVLLEICREAAIFAT